MDCVLEASNLSKRFGETVAVDAVSLKLRPGEILGLLGPNGAGKTTLAKTLVGLLKPSTGTVKYFGSEADARINAVKGLIAMVPQESAFYSSFTVRQNLEFFASLYGATGKYKVELASSLMKWLKLSRFGKRKAMVLSGGYKKLLNIACSLVNNPKLIFLDEPTVGLDPKMRQLLWDKILDLRMSGKTILLTTHYMDEAEQLCDRVALMRNGKIVVVDSPEKLIAKYGGRTILIFKLNREVEMGLIAKIKRLMPKTVVRATGSNLVLPVKQANSIRAVMRLTKAITEAGYEVMGSTVKEPQLEDVFVNLTKKAVELGTIKDQVLKAGKKLGGQSL